MQSLAEKKVEIFTSWEIAKKWSDTYVTEVDRENFLAKFKHDKYESEWVSTPLSALTYNHEQMPWDKFALWRFCAHARRREYNFTCLTSHPHTMLKTTTWNFSQSVSHFQGSSWRVTLFFFLKNHRFFQTSVVKHVQFVKLRKRPKNFFCDCRRMWSQIFFSRFDLIEGLDFGHLGLK